MADDTWHINIEVRVVDAAWFAKWGTSLADIEPAIRERIGAGDHLTVITLETTKD